MHALTLEGPHKLRPHTWQSSTRMSLLMLQRPPASTIMMTSAPLAALQEAHRRCTPLAAQLQLPHTRPLRPQHCTRHQQLQPRRPRLPSPLCLRQPLQLRPLHPQ